jgi:electron transport complex protein RnfG
VQIERPPSALRLVATLGIVGAISGLVLAVVHQQTRPRILRNQYQALRAAVQEVLPGSTRAALLVVRSGRLEPYDGPEGILPAEPLAFAGYDAAGALVGYAIAGAGPGFMDTIRLLYGFEPDRRTVIGMRVLDSRETPGLGDKIVFDEHFLANFAALEVEPKIVPVKRGKKAAPNEVDCITGATISSEAVVRILNKSVAEWEPLLPSAAGREAGAGAGAGTGKDGGDGGSGGR